MQSCNGMSKAIDELIRSDTPLERQITLINGMKAASMLGEGPAFKALMEHQATLVYLVEALDFSKKSDYEQRF